MDEVPDDQLTHHLDLSPSFSPTRTTALPDG
jgi:hypothetical protein